MAGPLSGLTIVELAGIGPGPMCSMMLGDMGADVIRVDRTKSARHGPPRRSQVRRAQQEPPLGLGRPAEEGRRRGRAAPDREGRRHDRAVPPRRRRAAGRRPRRLPQAQSQAGLRPHDRLGPGRPARQGGRPRHQLHRADRRAACDRRQGQADAAAQPGRRLRRRRHAAGLRHGVRPARGADARARARWSTPPWSTARRCCWAASTAWRAPACGTTTSARPTCSTAARTSTAPTRPRTASSSPSARSSRSSTSCCSRRPGLKGENLPAQMDRKAWARAQEPARAASSRPRRATNGARSWKAPTSASRRCSP